MSDQKYPFDPDTKEAIAEAWLAYQDSLTKIFEPLSDEQLMAFVGGTLEGDYFDRHTVEIARARSVLLWRRICERSKPILDAGGVYCVYHAQDIRECTEDHDWCEKKKA